MLGRLEMDVEECISAYNEIMGTIFREKSSWSPSNWSGQIKARFDSEKLRNAIEEVIIRHGASKTEYLNDGKLRGCRVYVILLYAT